jgi:spore coat polysaccharide biosynthesis predicted glycosyltransferase SpsG
VSDDYDDRIPHLFGLEYAVLGQGVTTISEEAFAKSLDSPVRRIAVSFGGADPNNETLATVKALTSNLEARLEVFLGPAYRHDVTASKLGADDGTKDVRVHRATKYFWAHLSRSSILVGGGGPLAYEAAHSGLPSVHLVGSDIQREMLVPLEAVGAIVVVDRDGEEPHRRLYEVVVRLGSETLREMRRAGLSLPLGNDHVRCIQAIEDRF